MPPLPLCLCCAVNMFLLPFLVYVPFSEEKWANRKVKSGQKLITGFNFLEDFQKPAVVCQRYSNCNWSQLFIHFLSSPSQVFMVLERQQSTLLR